ASLAAVAAAVLVSFLGFADKRFRAWVPKPQDRVQRAWARAGRLGDGQVQAALDGCLVNGAGRHHCFVLICLRVDPMAAVPFWNGRYRVSQAEPVSGDVRNGCIGGSPLLQLAVP